MNNLERKIELAVAAQVPLALWGRHGIGKTAVVEGLAEKGYYVKTLVLSQYDVLTLGGYPYREETDAGLVTKYAKPQWLRDLEEAAARGLKTILFLDELNRAKQVVLSVALRIVQERAIGDHRLPDGCLPTVACNPATETDRVTLLSDPLLDRFSHVAVEADYRAWRSWAEREGLNSALLDWVGESPASRFSPLTISGLFEEQVLARIVPTPRSLHAVGRIIDQFDSIHEALADQAALSLIIGLIGRENALDLVQYVEDLKDRTIPVRDFLADPDRAIKAANDLVVANQSQTLIASIEALYNWTEQNSNLGASEFEAALREEFNLPEDLSLRDALLNFAKVLLNIPRDIAYNTVATKLSWPSSSDRLECFSSWLAEDFADLPPEVREVAEQLLNLFDESRWFDEA